MYWACYLAGGVWLFPDCVQYWCIFDICVGFIRTWGPHRVWLLPGCTSRGGRPQNGRRRLYRSHTRSARVQCAGWRVAGRWLRRKCSLNKLSVNNVLYRSVRILILLENKVCGRLV
jgi:hypothetical protein